MSLAAPSMCQVRVPTSVEVAIVDREWGDAVVGATGSRVPRDLPALGGVHCAPQYLSSCPLPGRVLAVDHGFGGRPRRHRRRLHRPRPPRWRVVVT